MLALCAATAVVGLTALVAAASLRLPTFTSLLLGVYLLAAAEIVLLTEVLSLVHQVGVTGYVVGETLLLAVAVVAWVSRGRPRPPLPRVPTRALRAHPLVGVLALAVAASVVYQAFLVLAVAPNSWDSLAYHLARIAEWYQRGAVEYYPTHSESVNATQPNAEMLSLYTVVFTGRDTAAAAPQLFAELASLIAVYGIAVRLVFGRAAAAYAALLTGTLSLVALQATSTQNDLLAASFVGAAVYFALGRTGPELALAGLAIGLAIGTKAYAAFALPLVLLAGLLVHERRRLQQGVAYACAGVALVGAFGYVLNVVHTGRVLGDPDALGPMGGPDLTLAGTASTSVRIAYNFVDLSGYPLPDGATRPFELGAEDVFRLALISANPPGQTVLDPPAPAPFRFEINKEADEILSYYGPVGLLLLLLSAGFIVAVARRRAPPLMLVCALALPVFILTIALATKYSEYNGRYTFPAAVLTMPLASWLYRRRRLAWVVGAIGVLTLVLAHVDSNTKPTGAEAAPAIWSMTRSNAQAVTWPDMARVIEAVDANVEPDGRLGYVLRYNDWIYPFYGAELERKLVKLPRVGLFAAAQREGLDTVVVAGGFPAPPPGWRAIDFAADGWALLVRDRA